MFHDCADSSGKPQVCGAGVSTVEARLAVHLIRYDKKLPTWCHRAHIRSQEVRLTTPASHLRRGARCPDASYC